MWLIIVLIILILILTVRINVDKNKEGFQNYGSGQFCPDCSGRTYNQCLSCFNCGFCVDIFGNSSCINSTVASGPLNKEKCARLYMADPWNDMREMNDNYKCSYGPRQGNRRIGNGDLRIHKNLTE